MLRIMMMGLSLIAIGIVNVTTNTTPLNGQIIGSATNKLPVLFMPAGYVFIIWVIIYLLLIIWLYGFRQYHYNSPSSLQNRRTSLFVLSCLLTLAWILCWQYSFYSWTIITILALLLTLLILYFTYPKTDNQLFGRLPIGIFLGWVFILTITNVSYILTLHEWSGWGLSDPLWTVAYLTFATAVSLHFIYHHRDIALNSVFMWAFIGIAIHNGVNELFVSAAALFLTAVIGVSCFLVTKSREPNK
ncbi:tryptophan-rich sensory protein [Sporosarcina sp. FSL K6-1522]|uniref:tryptophan-rich sensory protein n=1 Tax=Sporosarcina sp. FSL K6-1522 TaxID=2921554 RepID=UPI00315A95E0